MDLFAESPLDLSAADGAAGEELLCSHYIAGFADAQREAARLDDNDPHQAEAARRAAAAQAATARGSRLGGVPLSGAAHGVPLSGDGGRLSTAIEVDMVLAPTEATSKGHTAHFVNHSEHNTETHMH